MLALMRWQRPCHFTVAAGVVPRATPMLVFGGEMNIASHGYGEVGGSLPAFVERAQQDAQWQAALARVGYRKVKAAYAKQMRESPEVEIFYGIQHLNHWPTMVFVRNWLKAEKKRALARASWTFMGAMLATILAGVTFVTALAVMR